MLISPPASRISEAYPSLARLSGAAEAHSIPLEILDGNLEGLMHLINSPAAGNDTETKRAVKAKHQSLSLLRSSEGYKNFDTYKSHVKRLNRLLAKSSLNDGHEISMSNYQDKTLLPVRSRDLKYAAQHFNENPFSSWFTKRIPEIMEEAAANGRPVTHIGLSVTFLSQALSAFAISGFIRKFYPGLKIIWGGGLITSWKEGAARTGLFPDEDTVITGTGEKPLLELFGIYSEKNFYTPDYHFALNNDYIAPGFILSYNTSVSCPWKKCTFCPETYEDNPYLQEGYPKAAGELKGLVIRYNPVLVHLTDSEISPAMLKALAANPPGAPWYGFCRFTKILTDLSFCRSLEEAGCRMLSLGLESADRDVLTAMNKGIKIDEVPLILENLKSCGIGTYVYVLFGTPAESRDSALRTRDFVASYAQNIDFLNAAVFNLPVKSPETAFLDTGAFYEGDLSLYTRFNHPKGWNRTNVRAFLKKEFSAEPEIRKILNRVPPVFDSSHAPFFV